MSTPTAVAISLGGGGHCRVVTPLHNPPRWMLVSCGRRVVVVSPAQTSSHPGGAERP